MGKTTRPLHLLYRAPLSRFIRSVTFEELSSGGRDKRFYQWS